MLNFIMSFLKSLNVRAISIVVGILAIFFSLFWLLSRLGVSLFYNILIVCILALIFLLVYLGYRYRSTLKGKGMAGFLKRAKDEGGRSLQNETIRSEMQAAIESLKATSLGRRYRGKAALYALPWYVIIGPSAVGKSTLLRNSGLHFPYNHGDDVSVKGLGGTRNCDWWFAEQAILLDTAGRYTTEDEDHDEWMDFLRGLRKYRSKMPLNGVVMAISLQEVLTASQKEFERHVSIMRKRVEELSEVFDYHLPIYLIFTKTDLMEGFKTFFDDLTEQERQQPWGISGLSQYEGDEFSRNLQNELDQLFARLAAQRLRKLGVERDSERKEAIYNFADQFYAAKSQIQSFVEAINRDNPYQSGARIFGLYFTSGEQQVEQRTRLLSDDLNPKQPFTIEYDGDADQESTEQSVSTVPKGYFIRDLFQQVIFSQAYLAVPGHKRRMSKRFLQASCFVGCSGALVASGLAFSAALHANNDVLERGRTVVENLNSVVEDNTADKQQHIRLLRKAQNFYHSIQHDKAGLPFYWRLGLYRGGRLLEPMAQSMTLIMQYDFLQKTEQKLKKQLRHYHHKWQHANQGERRDMRADYYFVLKTYLMLCYPQRLDPSFAASELNDEWSDILNQKKKDYTALITIYLSHLKENHEEMVMHSLTADKHLIKRARSQLAAHIDAKDLYSQVKMKASSQFSPVHLNDLFAQSQMFEANATLPGMYTRKAWNNGVKQDIQQVIDNAQKGDWVLSGRLDTLNERTVKLDHEHNLTDKQLQHLHHQVKSLYFDAYNRAWLQFLKHIRLSQFDSISQAQDSLKSLAGLDGPMVKLFKMVLNNSEISHASDINDMPLQQGMNQLLSSRGKQGSLKAYFSQLRDLKQEINDLNLSPDGQKALKKYSESIMQGQGQKTELYQSAVEAEKLLNAISNPAVAKAMKPLLLSPTKETWRIVLHKVLSNIDQQWRKQFIPSYRSTIAGKFPFSESGPDANLDDVKQMLQPDKGNLWKFIDDQLSPYIEYQAGHWQPKTWLDVGGPFKSEFLDALDKAKHISQALFAQGGNAGFSIEIYPYPTHGVSEISLSIGGHTYEYDNGPQEWSKISWDPSNYNQDAVLNVLTADGSSYTSKAYSGMWGLFHLLKSSHVHRVSQGTYRVRWVFNKNASHPLSIKLLMRSQNQADVLGLLLHPFSLPNHFISQRLKSSAMNDDLTVQ